MANGGRERNILQTKVQIKWKSFKYNTRILINNKVLVLVYVLFLCDVREERINPVSITHL